MMNAPAAPAPSAVSSAYSPGLMRDAISGLLVNEIVTSGTIHDRRKEALMTATIPASVSPKACSARREDPITTAAVVAMIGPINGATIIAPMTVAVDPESTP